MSDIDNNKIEATRGSNGLPVDTEDVVLTQPSTSPGQDSIATEPTAPEYHSDDFTKPRDFSPGEHNGDTVVSTQPHSIGDKGNGIDGQTEYMPDNSTAIVSEPNPGYVTTQQPLGEYNNKTNTDGYNPPSTYANTVGGSGDEICCYAMLISCPDCCQEFCNHLCCRHSRCCRCDLDCDTCCDCDFCDCDICDCMCGSAVCECCGCVGECLGDCLGGVCGGLGDCLCSCLS